MKAKVRSTGKIIEVQPNIDYNTGRVWFFNDEDEWGAYELELLPETSPEKVVFEGWVARDEPGVFSKCNQLLLFVMQPFMDWSHINGRTYGFWSRPGIGVGIPGSQESLPSVTWGTSPKRVKIEITLMDEEKA